MLDYKDIIIKHYALEYFGGVPSLVVYDNRKQAVIANKDWIEPELNKDYAEWAEHNHTLILPAKVKKPRFYRRKNVIGNSVKYFQNTPTVRHLLSLFC